MPQKISIQLPIVSAQVGDIYLASAIGFPEIVIASSKYESAVSQVRRRVTKVVRRYVAAELVQGLVRGEVSRTTTDVEFKPRRDEHGPRDPGWREPLSLSFDVMKWEILDRTATKNTTTSRPDRQDVSESVNLRVAIVPALQIRVVASPHTDFEKLIAEQIKATVLRRDNWSLAGLKNLDNYRWDRLISSRLSVTIDTPLEHQRRQSESKGSTTPTLRSLATPVKFSDEGAENARPTVGRKQEIERLGDLLDLNPLRQRARRSVLLVGPSGVGKSAIFRGWVTQHANRRKQNGVRVWATDGSRLISGQSGFGGWQQQCLKLVQEVRQTSAVVHLGNAMELSESGKAWGSGGCASALAPRIADGSLTAVLECTPEQYERLSRSEPRLINALTRIDIRPSDAEQTREILLDAAAHWKPIDITRDLQRKFSRRKRFHPSGKNRNGKTPNVKNAVEAQPAGLPPTTMTDTPPIDVRPDAIEWIDRLHRRFPTELSSPGRSLNFFETVMSELFTQQKPSSKDSEPLPPVQLTPQRVLDAFSRQTGLPSFLIDPAMRPDLESIARDLRSQVLGQDHVIDVLVDLIAVLAADLSRGDRPLASLLMIGPTGVGKTETAKALARLIYSDVSRLIRIDMSEYGDPLAGARLIGGVDPRTEGGGVLTSAVQAQPFSLILLDEFEKAHASVFDLLLQVLGEGRLTDRLGRIADFRNTVIMMTSNLGVEELRELPMGLSAGQTDSQSQALSSQRAEHFRRKVREFLRPEMYNRIDRILAFDALGQDTVKTLTRRQIIQLSRRDGLAQRNIDVVVEDSVVEQIASRGYQPQYGARPLARQIERDLLPGISDQLADKKQRDTTLQINVSDDQSVDLSFVKESNQRAGFKRGLTLSEHISSPIDTWGSKGSGGLQRVRPLLEPAPSDTPENSTSDIPPAPVTIDRRAWIDRITLLRRRSQSLLDCQAFRDVRLEFTRVDRNWKREWRTKKTPEERQKFRYGALGRERQTLRKVIDRGVNLNRQIQDLETDVLCEIQFGSPLVSKNQDSIDWQARTKELEDSLYEMLCDLLHPRSENRGRGTLILTGESIAAGRRLIEAYRNWATEEQFQIQVYAILQRDRKNRCDKIVAAEGWESKPSFRIPTQTERQQIKKRAVETGNKSNQNIGEIADEDRTKPDAADQVFLSLAAYRLKSLDCIGSPPDETLGWMIRFRGHMASMLVDGESGVHTFAGAGDLAGKSAKAQSTKPYARYENITRWLVQFCQGHPRTFVAPDWLAKADFQADGTPKRFYDLPGELVQDLTEFDSDVVGIGAADSRKTKMDRKGKWLGPLIHWNARMKVWTQLDDDWPTAESNSRQSQ